ncbi:MAG: serine/threonine-protein kinase [Blastocatellia bacterium]
MTPDRWKQVERLYHAALEREPESRAEFLDEACAADEELRREVASLLAYDDRPASFIEAPVLEVAARELATLSGAQTQPIALALIGAYQILSPLGRGGMGEVHLALDTRLGRKVAVKLLPARFTTDAERVRRFAQEARAASALNHPNIITIHEIGEVENIHYIVTEYVEGETLRQRMTNASQQRIEPSEAIDIAAQIAAALSAAHEAGIVHRDIKPENVMARRDGIIKVLDFGLAKLTEPSSADVYQQKFPGSARERLFLATWVPYGESETIVSVGR